MAHCRGKALSENYFGSIADIFSDKIARFVDKIGLKLY